MKEVAMGAPPGSILAAFAAHAAARPAAPCVTWQGQTLSYGQLAALVASSAEQFVVRGVARGDRVALFLPSSLAFLAAYLGAQATGAVAVLINPQYRAHELRHMLSDSAPRLVVTDNAGVAIVRELDSRQELLVLDPAALAAPISPGLQRAALSPQPSDLALLAYTSGTTGRAKGAMLTHGCLAANSHAVTTAWEWTASDRLLLTLPLFHIHGLGVGVHGTLLAGASLDLRPRFDAVEVLAALGSGEHTLFFGVPTIYTRLIAEASGDAGTPGGTDSLTPSSPPTVSTCSGKRSKPFHSSIRLFVSGSAPLSPQTFAAFEALFGQPILERYGMTETGMNLTNPLRGERRPGTVGGPFPGQEARVVDLRSREPLPDGEIGEIQVRGPHLCAGYWRNPEATAELFGPDGWFSTGDLGWRSADGYYTLTGRARELIISGGYNIYPRELEELLQEHPGVRECAVYGMPDPEFGERVVAAIVPTDLAAPPDVAELDAFCRAHLAAYKRPRELRFLDALPRNAMGKVEKHRLHAIE
jgi:malonyl-CoA/methylmalonyl-CoA synthetase